MLAKRHSAHAPGFSLIELLIAIAILGIVMAFALPQFRAWIQNSKVRAAAEAVLSGLQIARAEAVRRNVPVVFTLNANATTLWTIGCVTVVDPPSSQACPAVIQVRTAAEGGLVADGSLIIPFATDTAGNQIIFDSFGRKRATPANAADFGRVDVGGADNRKQRVIISTGGTARTCDPNLSAPDVRACP